MSYALLKLLYASTNSLGLPEIRFHNPLQKGEEQLFNEAIDIIKRYSFMNRIHWSLFQDEGDVKTVEFFGDKGLKPEIIYEPDIIMHGDITFKTYLKLKGFEEKDKGKLLDILMEAGVPVYRKNFSPSYRMREFDFPDMPVSKEVIEAETRKLFSQNITFYSEN